MADCGGHFIDLGLLVLLDLSGFLENGQPRYTTHDTMRRPFCWNTERPGTVHHNGINR